VSILAILQAAATLTWPPALPDGTAATGSSPLLLQPTATLRAGVHIAQTPPKVTFAYFDCQTYAPAKGGLWSNWGDGFVGPDGVFYTSIGDHNAPTGNAFLCAYDGASLRALTDLQTLKPFQPGQYMPGKIHSQIGLGKDGALYFSTHRGSTKVATMAGAEFKGDWIVKYDLKSGRAERIADSPLPLQSLPTGMLDGERLLFYAGTADGLNEKKPQFLVYDVANRKVVFTAENGPARSMIFAKSTGRVYFHAATDGPASLNRYDPARPAQLTPISASVGLRCATDESADGMVYTIDRDRLWAFDTRAETAKELGSTAVGEKDYITSVDLDAKTGRYLYYVPGSHGGAEVDGSPLVQYDLKTGARKVIAFLRPYLHETYGYIPMGTYCSALSAEGDKVYITWNGHRGTTPEEFAQGAKIKFETCALTVVEIPASERQP